MLQLSSLLVFVSLLVLVSYHQGSATIIIPKHNNATDRGSLLMFKSAITSDPHGALTMQWNDTVHFCEWQGVTCGGDRRHPERVVALNLTSLGLVGVISPALANLTFLRSINLSTNYFHGPIPRELERLPRLKILKLGNNSLTGGIPRELGLCSQLRTIDLAHNMLGGSIPSELGSLFSLNYLSLRSNSIDGQIPSALGNLSSLVILDFVNNSISGNIPPTLGKLSILTYLNLALNNLDGAIPTPLWNLSSLENLQLHFNKLYGSLPPDIGQLLPNLLILSVGVNKMHGHIPTSLSNASNINYIQLGQNNFGGIIPESLGRLPLTFFDVYSNNLEAKDADDWRFLTALTNCSQLQILQLDYNNLGGMLPQSIQNLSTTTLQVLTLGNNYIHGSIPSQIGNLVNLEYLDMGPNLLIGSIPDSIGMISNLNILDFNSNNMTGEIPSTIGNLTQLNELHLGANSLSSSIPARLGNCRQLTLLDLGYNKLTGSIPKEVLTISSLSTVLSLGENLLTGSMPEIGNLMNLEILSLYGNNLSGEIPVTLGKCVVLQRLYLQNNYFEGSIPSSLRTLMGIQELDFSHNNLSGQIPTFLEDFQGLYNLNLSFNSFEGEVPSKGVFANASGVSVLGNKMLCGGNPKLHLTSCPPTTQAPKKCRSSKLLPVIIPIVSAFGCLILLLLLVVARYCLVKSTRDLAAKNVIKEQHSRISYGELARATDGFSEENLIGFGSFGSVYKGRLDDEHDTKLVAVKVFNLQQPGAYESFIVECDALKNIRHRNLVKIVTACSSTDFRGNEFKAMVLELMINGNLETWLYPEPNGSCESKKLNFMQRLNIAIDVASALDYLHHHGQIPIVHCDLKPSNILLDDEMVAHVGDFGLAKFLIESTGNSTSSSGLKGSVGYVAPEYGVANKVSTHGDVYSYGILLLELFTAKRPTDDIFKNGLSLTKFVEMAIPEQVMDIIDVQMFFGESGMEEANRDAVTYARTTDCVASVLRVGLSCTKELAAERVDMKVVTSKLHAIRNTFLETKSTGEKELSDKCKIYRASA